jgi:hypothetical protein
MALWTTSAGGSQSTEVACGETLERGHGHLTADCTGSITIEKGKLHLFGHTITATGLSGIDCVNSCKIFGPGKIIGAGTSFGVLGDYRVQTFDVEQISGHSVSGVRSGVRGVVRVENPEIFGNGTGLTGARIKITESVVRDNTTDGRVATSRGVKMKNCTVTGNGRDGVGALLDNTEPRRVRAIDSIVNNNSEFGIIARNVKLLRSFVLDNALSSECHDTIACADVASIQKPKKDFMSLCDRSLRIPEVFVGPVPTGPTWAFCSRDAYPP